MTSQYLVLNSYFATATANSTTLSELRGYCITNGDLLLHSILIFCQRTWMQRATIWNPRGSLCEPSCTGCHTQLVWGSSLQITATNPRFVQGKVSWSIAYWKQFQHSAQEPSLSSPSINFLTVSLQIIQQLICFILWVSRCFFLNNQLYWHILYCFGFNLKKKIL